jgi:hypothetical protein
VIGTTGSVQTHEMTTEGAGIGTKDPQEDMKEDATIVTNIETGSGEGEVAIAKRIEILTETETAIGGIKVRPCLTHRAAQGPGIVKTGRRKTEIRRYCGRNGVYEHDDRGRPN